MRKITLLAGTILVTALIGLNVILNIASARPAYGSEKTEQNSDSTISDYEEKDIEELISGIYSIEPALKSGYRKFNALSIQQLQTGDIMEYNEELFVYIECKENNCCWWNISGTEIEKSVEIDFSEDAFYYRYEKTNPPYPEPDCITAPIGTVKKDIPLPSGFSWVNEDETLNQIGEMECEVIFTPENQLKYNTIVVKVPMLVTRVKSEIEVPESITVSYTKGLTLKNIMLPENWEFQDPDIQIEKAGTYRYKAVYVGTMESDALETYVEITVKKSCIKISGIMLSVTENSTLQNDMLPGVENGTLEWDNAGGSITETGIYTCHFIPDEPENYVGSSGIETIVNVIPDAILVASSEKNEIFDKEKEPTGSLANEVLVDTLDKEEGIIITPVKALEGSNIGVMEGNKENEQQLPNITDIIISDAQTGEETNATKIDESQELTQLVDQYIPEDIVIGNWSDSTSAQTEEYPNSQNTENSQNKKEELEAGDNKMNDKNIPIGGIVFGAAIVSTIIGISCTKLLKKKKLKK